MIDLSPYVNGRRLVKASSKTARYAVCLDGCGLIHGPDKPWGPPKSVAIHRNGTGHTVVFADVAG